MKPPEESFLRVALLGPIRGWNGDREVALGPPKQRAVLGLLASRVNDVVTVDGIIDGVWGSEVPRTAVNGVHTYVAGLRQALEPGRGRRANGALIVSVDGGYSLRADAEHVDALQFERRHAEARRLRSRGDIDAAIRCLGAGLSLWRGTAHAGVPGPFAATDRTRLQDLRLTAIEEWAADLVSVGRHPEAVTVLSDTVAMEPLRERLRELLMLALFLSGRQAHALELYRETRRLLTTELGVEPGVALRRLHEQILAGRAGITPGPRTVPPAPAAPMPGGLPKPRQLPPAVRDFVGRRDELAHLRESLDCDTSGPSSTPAVALITGAPGVGKSELALQLAHGLAESFPDGQLYVDCDGSGLRGRPLGAADALLHVLRSLGVEESAVPADLRGRSALYRSVLAGRRMLVLLDDVCRPEQVRPLIPCGPSGLVSTSRQRLRGLVVRDGAHRIRLDPLPETEAAHLVARLSGGRLTEREEPTARLVRLCGGLPLALRIVAEAVSSEPGLPPTAVVDRYLPERGGLARFTVDGDESAGLRAVLDASYRALPTEAARLFRLLGLYPGATITAPAAAALAGTDTAHVLGQLRTLADNHLLEEAGRHRYRLHHLLALFAAELAQQEPCGEREAALERLFRRGLPTDGHGGRAARPLTPRTSVSRR
ncbi:BTAD domain-containing putative transcriptional regulator [Streptomyces sp. NPDC012935]|uniref:AfsR/SARP family transcriptional regulator n=1 Tax=Streptomyces sp. NPDC012935 TaxID=3364857 RepID=UPI0036A57B23